MNSSVKYTYPEQYIIYLNDKELLQCLMGVITQESSCVTDNDMLNEDRINKIAEVINKQFNMEIANAIAYVRSTVYKEAAKRWLKLQYSPLKRYL